MAANYLHGVETIEVERGPRPVRTVKSAVIGLIGTAPIGAVNAATLTLSEKDAATFGSQLPGFTIPQALDAIYDHGAGTVIVWDHGSWQPAADPQQGLKDGKLVFRQSGLLSGKQLDSLIEQIAALEA